MDMTPPNFYLLLIAVFSLAIGLIIFFRINRPDYRGNPLSASLLSWLLIALFPVFMIYAFFPENSQIQGRLLGFRMGGAMAALIFIWWFGAKKTIDAIDKDKLNREIAALQAQLSSAQIINTPKPQKLPDGQTHPYSLVKAENKKITLVTGRFEAVKNIDVWVNSENTNMQMASYFDRSVSGMIRYYGAKRDEFGNVTQDIIYPELERALGGNIVVMPATVLATDAGELAATHGVKKIFHVAAVYGMPGVGYKSVDNLGACVTNALAKADSPALAPLKLRSIIFPLLGTGQGGGDPRVAVRSLIEAAISYLENNPATNIETVYFLTLYDNHLAMCQEVLQASASVRP